MREESLLLERQLCFALVAASRAITGAYTPHLKPLGLTYPQYLVLLALWEEDGLRVSRLGERLRLDSGTLTPLLKRLEAQGVVERRRSGEDERVVEVSLTDAGRALKTRASAIPDAIACRVGRPSNDVAALRESLQRLVTLLDSPALETEP